MLYQGLQVVCAHTLCSCDHAHHPFNHIAFLAGGEDPSIPLFETQYEQYVYEASQWGYKVVAEKGDRPGRLCLREVAQCQPLSNMNH